MKRRAGKATRGQGIEASSGRLDAPDAARSSPDASMPHALTSPPRRGLSLLELLLAMSITALVAAAIAGMLAAVSSGVGTRRDNRSVMVLSNSAEARVSAYIAPCRCVLKSDATELVIWLNDARAGETVHATELRWFNFDQAAGTLEVSYVKFPGNWTQAACDLEDQEYAATTNWSTVLGMYQSSGWIAKRILIDNLLSFAVTTDTKDVTDSRLVNLDLQFKTESENMPVLVSCTILQHFTPVK